MGYLYCEADRLVGIQQPSNAYSSLSFLVTAVFILHRSVIKIREHRVKVPRQNQAPRGIPRKRGKSADSLLPFHNGDSGNNLNFVFDLWMRAGIFCSILIALALGSFWFHADMNHESAYGDFMGMIGLVSYLTAFTLIKRPLLSSGVTFATCFMMILLVNVALRVMLDLGTHVDVTLPLFILSLALFGVGEGFEYSAKLKAWKHCHFEDHRSKKWWTRLKLMAFPAVLSKPSAGYLITSVILLAVSFAAWSLDNWRIVCEPTSALQLHSFWHILNSVACYHVFIYMSQDEPLEKALKGQGKRWYSESDRTVYVSNYF